ncbi:MAG: hypothetical protein AVDCRST_MAG02-3511 [uncultured Rubrobacteraceae bacterium]|uniref:Uncharacterized protein n=1 Tax=uncultured Rubrobacteraceae bacterium TaxID=349277 RepID=A0A6J4RCA1_9ACTN|nr:MAG: hypothetical protein AVDCRST_MAG02-3511 [uncultured Rubrobacteraceae bacterium]
MRRSGLPTRFPVFVCVLSIPLSAGRVCNIGTASRQERSWP